MKHTSKISSDLPVRVVLTFRKGVIIGYAIYLTFENFRKTLLESEQAISYYRIDNHKVDTFYDIAFPGGIHLDWLTKNWGVLDYRFLASTCNLANVHVCFVYLTFINGVKI